MIYVIFLFFFF